MFMQGLVEQKNCHKDLRQYLGIVSSVTWKLQTTPHMLIFNQEFNKFCTISNFQQYKLHSTSKKNHIKSCIFLFSDCLLFTSPQLCK